MAQISLEARIPTLGVTTGEALVPAQSQSTDIFLMTLTKVIFFPKWSRVALLDSLILSISSSVPISHWLFCPGVVWIIAFPILPSALPIPIFLFEPPKPPATWPLKWVRTTRES